MLLLQFLSICCLGVFLGSLTKFVLYDTFHNKIFLVEVISVAVAIVAAKNYIARLILDIDVRHFVQTGLTPCINWLCFGFGYSLVLHVLLKESGEETLTRKIVMSCLFITTTLLISSNATLLITL